MKTVLFSITDQNDNQNIVDTNYYNWLINNNVKDIVANETKILYLTEQGFNITINKLTTEDLNRLKHIENYYVFNVLKPIWNKEKTC